jgi:hypothetical protein
MQGHRPVFACKCEREQRDCELQSPGIIDPPSKIIRVAMEVRAEIERVNVREIKHRDEHYGSFIADDRPVVDARLRGTLISRR